MSPSRTPKIRPISSGGTERCNSVRVATSSRQWPAPATTSRTIVPPSPRPNATAASAPLKTSAAARIGPPRRRPTRTTLTVAASSAPMPKANCR